LHNHQKLAVEDTQGIVAEAHCIAQWAQDMLQAARNHTLVVALEVVLGSLAENILHPFPYFWADSD
jgi:hypothetical protein